MPSSASLRLAVKFLVLCLPVSAQTPSLPQQIAGRLTVNALKADVSFLASDALQGRCTPSAGLEIAGEYIASEFRRAGLEPAGDEGYFQTASFANITPNPEGLQLTLEAGGAAITADKSSVAIQEAVAVDLSHTPVVQVPLAEAEALTVEQIRGKVLVFDPPDSPQTITRSMTALAARLQPALVILLRSAGRAAPPAARLREVSAQLPVPILVVWDADIRKVIAGKPDATVSAHIAAPLSVPVKLRNVIGVLRGSDPQL